MSVKPISAHSRSMAPGFFAAKPDVQKERASFDPGALIQKVTDPASHLSMADAIDPVDKRSLLSAHAHEASEPEDLPAVSVVMAAYNGQRYIREQLMSIVCQMEHQDELVISLDPSTDATQQIIQNIQSENVDLKIVLVHGPGKGLIANFEHALGFAHNPVIVFSDQDDRWKGDKLDVIRHAFAKKPQLMALVHDAQICSDDLQTVEPSYMKAHGSKNGLFNNLVRNSFIGCCMAVRKPVVDASLPFPYPIPMHDQFIGMQALRMGEVEFIDEVLIDYRRHQDNASSLKPSSFGDQIKWRLQLIQGLSKRKAKGIQKRKGLKTLHIS